MSDKLREAIGGFPARKNNHQLLEEEVSFDRITPINLPILQKLILSYFPGKPAPTLQNPFFCSSCLLSLYLLLSDFLAFSRCHSQVFHSAFSSFTHRVFSSSTHTHTFSLSGSCFFTWSSQLPLTCLFSHSLACLPFSHSHESLSCSFFRWSTYSLLNR